MSRLILRRFIALPLGLLLSISVSARGQQRGNVVFEDNFEREVRNEWSIRRITTAPLGGRMFLGPFESGAVELSLKQLPAHSFVRVSFDLLILGSWDGDATQDGAGPDVFALLTGDGRILHFTSFATGIEVTRHLSVQGFPGLFGIHSAAARSGAVEKDTLGFRYAGMPADAVYHLECVFPHSDAALSLRFIGSTSSLTADETWGLDNVRVTVEDIPVDGPASTTVLAGAWEQLRSEDPAAAMKGVSILVQAGDAASRLIRDRIQGQSIPDAASIDPSHPTLIPTPASAHGMRTLTDPTQRRLALAAHVLQMIGTETARVLLASAQRPADPAALVPLQVTLRDSSARMPLAGLPVRISNYGTGSAVAITDNMGRASISVPQGAAQRDFSLQIAAEGYIPMSGRWTARFDGAEPAKLDVDLERGITIGGRVSDDLGQPVENAIVLLKFQQGEVAAEQALRQLDPFLTARTGKDGRWTFDNAPRNRPAVAVGLYQPQHATLPSGLFSMAGFAEVQSLYARTATMTLERGVPIEGTVVDSAGNPVPHAILSWGQSRFGSNLLPDQTSDDKGRFRLASFPQQTVYLTVKAPGLAPEMMRIEVADQPIQTRFELSPARTLTGRVVAPDGAPIAGAMLYLAGWRGTNALDMRLFTDSNGRFIWDAAPGDEIRADVSGSGFRERSSAVLNANQDNVIMLDRESR